MFLFQLNALESILVYFNWSITVRLVAIIAGGYASYRTAHALFFSPLRHIPGSFLARLTPLRSQLINISGRVGQMTKKEYSMYGDIYVMGPNAVVISNPVDIKAVLASHAFVKSDFYMGFDTFGIENTVSARNPKVASMRKRQLGPYFNPAYISRMEHDILRYGILGLKSKWDSELAQSSSGRIEIDYSRDFTLATLDSISALAFGIEPRGLKDNDATAADRVEAALTIHGIHAMMPLFKFFPFSLATWHWESQYRKLIHHCNESIAARRKHLAEGGKKPADLLQAFLDAQDPESKTPMDERQIHASSIEVMLAGTGTTSNALQWATHLLMLHPELRARAVDEVRSNFAADHVITYVDVKKSLPFVEACIYEALRLCPVPGGIVPRVTPPGGITLQGHFIPEGTEVWASYSGSSIHKSTWDEPLKYDPTRFLDNDKSRSNFLTFSSGVRICSGRHLAWAEVSTILANMLKDYDLSLPDDYTHLGPSVLDDSGYPKLMESVIYAASTPAHPQRDCRLVLARRM
ncbi:putative cytochrome P450 monooxygenase [Linderina pennispora]|uniref:Putative cytochrome P450 monooxygenase n=1 Tax=Linderina pennispora TaxID=61395 RepID=A0A1Y1WC56_9FUNG|nr:putative cytochrome P450 monooxygenase [Linderina pennispora]ORX70908.1 putative cytochrome P450 monooxygenase [Linderina pennispora]